MKLRSGPESAPDGYEITPPADAGPGSQVKLGDADGNGLWKFQTEDIEDFIKKQRTE
jgi:hypothetical protein